MRNFEETFATIIDDRGNPLQGRIGFYVPSTTEFKEIFDADGVRLPNPIYVNGIPDFQVFLDENSDYTIRYERYIGSGNFRYDEAPESWMLYKTELNKGIPVAISVDSGSAFGTIEELKAASTESIEDLTTIWCYGYDSVGDCPPRTFTWYANSTANEDGGYIIKADGSEVGRWIMNVPSDNIDVRWFGDIPHTSASWVNNEINLSKRAAAASCANLLGKDLYFPRGYYLYDGSNTISVSKNIVCDDGVFFVIKAGTTGSSIQCKEFVRNNGILFVPQSGESLAGGHSLVADWLDESWLVETRPDVYGARIGYRLHSTEDVVRRYENVTIVIDAGVTFHTDDYFENCIIDGVQCCSEGNSFNGMTINGDWFADSFDFTSLKLEACKVYLSEIKNATNYVKLKKKLNETDLGSLGFQALDNVVLQSNTSVADVTGSVIAEGNIAIRNGKNLALTFNGAGHNLSLEDSSINLAEETTLGDFVCNNSVIAGDVVCIGSLSVKGSSVNKVDIMGSNASIRYSRLFGDVIITSDAICEISDNLVANDAHIVLANENHGILRIQNNCGNEEMLQGFTSGDEKVIIEGNSLKKTTAIIYDLLDGESIVVPTSTKALCQKGGKISFEIPLTYSPNQSFTTTPPPFGSCYKNFLRSGDTSSSRDRLFNLGLTSRINEGRFFYGVPNKFKVGFSLRIGDETNNSANYIFSSCTSTASLAYPEGTRRGQWNEVKTSLSTKKFVLDTGTRIFGRDWNEIFNELDGATKATLYVEMEDLD